MIDVFKTLDLSDDNENFRGYTTIIELYNALKFITTLIFIQKISRFNLAVAFLKSVRIILIEIAPSPYIFIISICPVAMNQSRTNGPINAHLTIAQV